MLTPIQKDIFDLLVKHYGEHNSYAKLNMNSRAVINEFTAIVALFAVFRASGNAAGAARTVGMNRNSMRKYSKLIDGFDSSSIARNRREAAFRLGLYDSCR
jgi:hypothetical protein